MNLPPDDPNLHRPQQHIPHIPERPVRPVPRTPEALQPKGPALPKQNLPKAHLPPDNLVINKEIEKIKPSRSEEAVRPYKHSIDKSAAELLLKDELPRSFIIRNSFHYPDFLVISIVDENQKTSHSLFLINDDGSVSEPKNPLNPKKSDLVTLALNFQEYVKKNKSDVSLGIKNPEAKSEPVEKAHDVFKESAANQAIRIEELTRSAKEITSKRERLERMSQPNTAELDLLVVAKNELLKKVEKEREKLGEKSVHAMLEKEFNTQLENVERSLEEVELFNFCAKEPSKYKGESTSLESRRSLGKPGDWVVYRDISKGYILAYMDSQRSVHEGRFGLINKFGKYHLYLTTFQGRKLEGFNVRELVERLTTPGAQAARQELSPPKPPPIARDLLPKAGETFDPSELESRADVHAPRAFSVGELAIVLRTTGKFQYVVIVGVHGKDITFDDMSGKLNDKNIVAFCKVKPGKENNSPVIEEPLTPDEQAFEQFQAEELGAEGIRTKASKSFVMDLSCSKYSGLVIGNRGKDYVAVTGNFQKFSTMPSASCGSSLSREIVLLDPLNSPLLNGHFQALRTRLNDLAQRQSVPLTPEQVLKAVMAYVRTHIFPSCRDPDLLKKTEDIVNNARVDGRHDTTTNKTDPTKTQIPLISIEEFVKAGVGVCRHHGLVTSYLLERLIKEPPEKPFLNGTVQHIRDNVPRGAHVWTTFIPKHDGISPQQKWHLDTLWGNVENFATQPGFKTLQSMYGEAINRQEQRTLEAARMNNQPTVLLGRASPPRAVLQMALPKAVLPPEMQPQRRSPPAAGLPSPKAVLPPEIQPRRRSPPVDPLSKIDTELQKKLKSVFLQQLLDDIRNRVASGKILTNDFMVIQYGNDQEASLENPKMTYYINHDDTGVTLSVHIDNGTLNAVRNLEIILREDIKLKSLKITGEQGKEFIKALQKLSVT